MSYLTPPPSPCRQASPDRNSSPTRLSSPTPPSSRHSSPSQHSSPNQYTSLTRLSSPKTLHRIPNHYLARERKIKRASKANHIGLENTRLRIENQRLQGELATLKASATHSQEEAFQLQNSITSLKDENTELKKTIRLQKPLVKVGVCIRKRFLEKTRSAKYHTRELAGVVSDGNRAAHECCVAADAALFELGYMNAVQKPVQRRCESFRIGEDGKVMFKGMDKEERLEIRYRELFYELYGREAEDSRSHPWGKRERRVWDMIGTMLSCSEGFVLGEMESGDEWFDRFNELVEELNGVKREIAEQCADWDDRVKAFEESDEVDARLREMKDIVHETRLWSWRENRLLNREGLCEMGVEVGMDEKAEYESEEEDMKISKGSDGETELNKDCDVLMDE
ncbi:hypothetical protein N431DRAFT_343313 [Stipitochalara longipes BDJ]|nr:hypothetical protein N431DRAFT_343313 [Stipitochalara longipes BDJ]